MELNGVDESQLTLESGTNIKMEGDQNRINQRHIFVSHNCTQEKVIKYRNLFAFWFFGLTNNFAYVVMLSAAHDILADVPKNQTQFSNGTEMRNISNLTRVPLIPNCNKIGTGAILLADILPALFIKLTAPWYMMKIPYTLRLLFVFATMTASFPIVSFSKVVWLSLVGVCFASLSSGFGEILFLPLTSFFNRNTISAWSSGTGFAGVAGALVYLALTASGLSHQLSILILVVVPVFMILNYFVILVRPDNLKMKSNCKKNEEEESFLDEEENEFSDQPEIPKNVTPKLSLGEKFKIAFKLSNYMVPLATVYFAEYFINQAIFELLVFPNIWMAVPAQYRWYQGIYQIGVFLSRSSVNLFRIKRVWILSILQVLNILILMLQIFFRFIPSIWIIFVIILYEGLLGGCAYVNTFYSISLEVPENEREFSLGLASVSDSFGIAISGLVAVPVHNYLCSL